MILRLWVCFVVAVLLITLPAAAFQDTGVVAEAVGQANLRAAADVNSTMLGQIQIGTRYPVIGQSQFYPWLLLGDTALLQPIGWVYKDLVTVSGNLAAVPFSDILLDVTVPPTLTPALASPTPTANIVSGMVSPPTPTPASGIVGRASGEINIRYGPGVEYPRVGIGQAGDIYEITAWHTQLPWLQISYPSAPNGYGWVANELLEVQGDVFSLSGISQLQFGLPTLTPTPPVVLQSVWPGSTPVPLSPSFQALGDQLWQMMLDARFEPGTSRLGALFLMNLRTGEAITFGNDIAFSGMSIVKIPILMELYRTLGTPPDDTTAYAIAETMVCSQNTTSNEILRIIGGEDPLAGTARVTEFLQQIGMKHTFIAAPFLIDPSSTPLPNLRAPITDADQQSAQPDLFNQMAVDEVGWLLDGLYQCAAQSSGPLMSRFPGEFSPEECRQMIYVMSNNNIGELIEAGVPANIQVAHKHGWIEDTHGNAGIVFTPGGDYAMVVALHNPVFLDYSESFPLIAEMSRTVYNYFNPDAPMAAIRRESVPAQCDLLGSPLISNLVAGTAG